MCRTCGRRHNSMEIDTSPGGGGHDGSLDSNSSYTHEWRTVGGSGVSSTDGCGGGSTGLTMKEYDQHLARLNKENFALKLRVYFLEEQQTGQPHLPKAASIELKVENESLKRQVFEKQQLLSEASTAMSQLEEEYKEQLSGLLREQEDRMALQQKNLEEYSNRCQELEAALREQQRHQSNSAGELTQLCDLAFPATEATSKPAGAVTGWNNALWSTTTDQGVTWDCDKIAGEVWAAGTAQADDTNASTAAGRPSTDGGELLQRKLSTDSQNGSYASSECGGGAGADPNNPVHINTTNVTNNNINNTLPNTSNNLQQMQYQHPPPPSQQRQSPPPPYNQQTTQEQHHHHHYQSADAGDATKVVLLPQAGGGDATTSPAEGRQQYGGAVPAAATTAGMMPPPQMQGVFGDCMQQPRVEQLHAEMRGLQEQLQQLQEQLQYKDQVTAALYADLDNLRKELQEKETEMQEKEERMDNLSQELETRHQQLQCKDDTIHTLHTDLNRVEPEISVKVQEIVERDRIIEEKSEQIEQQNKILVEIQITLDEKQKQIAELEASMSEARERVKELEKDYDKSCGVINGFIIDVSARDKEICTLKKEGKKKDRKIKDLVAQLKETLDMLDKAKWEAETAGGGGEDSVKEMVEEESERLWADLEQRKLDIESLRNELSKAVETASQKTATLNGQLSSCQDIMKRNEETEKTLKQQLQDLTSEVQNREALLQQNGKEVEHLKAELNNVKTELRDKKLELYTIKSNSDGSDQQLEKLRHKLDVCKADKAREIDSLKGQIELKNSDILHLQSQLIVEAKQDASTKMTSEGASRSVVTDKSFDVAQTRNAPMSYEPVQVRITAGVMSSAAPVAIPIENTERRKMNLSIETQQQPEKMDAIQVDDAVDRATKVSDKYGDENKKTVGKFQRRIENLRLELKNAKKSIGNQMIEFGVKRNYQGIVRKYLHEVIKLRKRLSESNNACDMLRSRLEELAEFLEQILDMEERGLIDLSKLSSFSKTKLHKSLNDSRALSQTLSQSILMGMDTMLDEGIPLDYETEFDYTEDTNRSLYYHGDADETIASSVGNRTLATSALRESLLVEPVHLDDTRYETLSSKLCSDVEEKAMQLDVILEQLSQMSENLDEREVEVVNQSSVIMELRGQLSELKQKLSQYELVSQSGSANMASTSSNRETQYDVNQLTEVGCQTMLAMAPCQSQVSSLADLSTPYLSSCTESLCYSNAKLATEILESKDHSIINHLELEIILQEEKSKTLFQETDGATKNLSPQVVAVDIVSSLTPESKVTPKGNLNSGCVSAGEIHPVAHYIPASHSESEAWSEPDRSVSLARIGLEAGILATSLDRSLSRSRQTRASAALSSESDNEESAVMPEEPATIMLQSLNQSIPFGIAAKTISKRKTDASELRRLSARLRSVEHLNDALYAELKIYDRLNHQLSPTTDQQQSTDCKPCSSVITAPHSNQEQADLGSNTTALAATSSSRSFSSNSLPFALKKSRRFATVGEDSLALAAPLLKEIRSLRTKLEESISNNDQLRDQLETAVVSCNRASDDPSHLTHLTAALLNAQETLQLTREKLSFAQRCEQVQSDRCTLAERRVEDCTKLCEELRQQLRDAQDRVTETAVRTDLADANWNKRMDQLQARYNEAETKLKQANRLHEECELKLQERLAEVTQACEDSEARLAEQHEAINEVYNSLKETSHWPHLSHLHSALQASETQVLKVTRDRLVLLGEKSKLQAQLMSAQAQTSLLQDSLCEDEEPVPPMLYQQLAQVQAAVKSLQDQCSRLQAANATLQKQKDYFQEKLAGYKAVEKLVNKSDITLETVVASEASNGRNTSSSLAESSRLNTVAFHQLQRNHSLLQEDYTHLQKLYNQLQEEEKQTCQKLHDTTVTSQKSRHNIDALTQQYQDKIQQVQIDCNEKMVDAEKQVSAMQTRSQDRVIMIEEKLLAGQTRCLEKIEEAKKGYEEESRRQEAKLHQLMLQLDTERKNSETLMAELGSLQRRLPLSDDGAAWSDNKENLRDRSYIKEVRSSGLKACSIKFNPTIARASRHSSDNQYSSLLTSFPSSNNPSSLLRSPVRDLHCSEPSLCLAYTTEEEEQEEEDEARESPDLGLGSSDNGQMSSLERVMGDSSRRGRVASQSSLHDIAVHITERSSLPLELTHVTAAGAVTSLLCSEPSHRSLSHSIQQLQREVAHLQQQLSSSDTSLTAALQQLASANARKHTVERAIGRQLIKTHQVLKKSKVNLELHQGAQERHASLN